MARNIFIKILCTYAEYYRYLMHTLNLRSYGLPAFL